MCRPLIKVSVSEALKRDASFEINDWSGSDETYVCTRILDSIDTRVDYLSYIMKFNVLFLMYDLSFSGTYFTSGLTKNLFLLGYH